MHDRDNQHGALCSDRKHCHPAFDTWLKLADMLDKIICYYRPTGAAESTGWEDDFPSFEDLLGDDAELLEGSMLGGWFM